MCDGGMEISHRTYFDMDFGDTICRNPEEPLI